MVEPAAQEPHLQFLVLLHHTQAVVEVPSKALPLLLVALAELAAAVQRAKSYLTAALIASDKLDVGSGEGHGPVHHFHGLWG